MKTQDAYYDFNPARIAWCCGQTGITLADLAKATKNSKQRLQEGKLTHRQMGRVADYFGYSHFFFMTEGIPKNAAHAVMFKTVANQQGIALNPSLLRVINHAQCHAGTYAGIMEEWKKPVSFAPPALSGSIENKARQTREWLGLRDSQTYAFRHYRRLLEQKEILIVRSQTYKGEFQLDHPKVVGFSMPDGEVPLIFVKKTTPERQTFTLFHELGHLLLHSKSSHIDSEEALHGGDSAKQEQEANRFAARCLVPDSDLNAIKTIPKKAEDFDRGLIGLVAARLGISTEVVVRLLYEQKRIGRAQYARYSAFLRKKRAKDAPLPARKAPKAARYLEPLEVFGAQYVRMIFDAMIDGEVTLSKACNYLGGVQVDDVLELGKHQIGGCGAAGQC